MESTFCESTDAGPAHGRASSMRASSGRDIGIIGFMGCRSFSASLDKNSTLKETNVADTVTRYCARWTRQSQMHESDDTVGYVKRFMDERGHKKFLH